MQCIGSYMPDLTPEEATRFWLPPAELCRLGAIGEASDPKVKKMLNTLSDRGHIPCVKSGPSRTHPRHYSLKSAAMLRTFVEIVNTGRTYKYAQPVADKVGDLLLETLAAFKDPYQAHAALEHVAVIFEGMRKNGEAGGVRVHRGDHMPKWFGLEFSALDAGYLIKRITEDYEEFWRPDLEARGEIDPAPARAPMQFTEDGWPIWPEDRG